MNRAAVLGTGLIGSSVGLGLRRSGWSVVGWDPDHGVAAVALERGALDRVAAGRDDAVESAELVVLAGPPAEVVATLPTLSTGALVTDVAGVKLPVVKAAAHLKRFVGGHPMAGREVVGPEAASAALFRGAAWVLVTDGAAETDLVELERVVESVGARPVRMTAAEHDDAVATISHLPQVVAAALVREASDHPAALGLASGSFRDLTRVAASDPALWSRLLTANGAEVAAALSSFASRLGEWATAIAGGDVAALEAALASARQQRAGLAPAVVAVQVALADQPGELARVGRALDDSRVDVRDLQLRHAPHGGGGILTLSVRPGEAEGLRASLQAEDLLVVE